MKHAHTTNDEKTEYNKNDDSVQKRFGKHGPLIDLFEDEEPQDEELPPPDEGSKDLSDETSPEAASPDAFVEDEAPENFENIEGQTKDDLFDEAEKQPEAEEACEPLKNSESAETPEDETSEADDEADIADEQSAETPETETEDSPAEKGEDEELSSIAPDNPNDIKDNNDTVDIGIQNEIPDEPAENTDNSAEEKTNEPCKASAEAAEDAQDDAENAYKHASTEEVRSIFTNISEDYDRFSEVASFGSNRLWLEHFIDFIPNERSLKILDLAAGTGDVTFKIAQKKHVAKIVCTDLTPDMLKIARKRFAKGQGRGTSIEFRIEDAQNLSFAENSFDVVSIAYGIRNIPDRAAALSEMHRVLRPGGLMLCLEFSRPPLWLWRKLYNFYLDHVIPFWGKRLSGEENANEFSYFVDSIKNFPDQQSFANLIEAAGFEGVGWKNYTGGIVAIHWANKPALGNAQVK